jgi:hypothetical protein
VVLATLAVAGIASVWSLRRPPDRLPGTPAAAPVDSAGAPRPSSATADREKELRARIESLRFELGRLDARARDLQQQAAHHVGFQRQAEDERARIRDPVRDAVRFIELGNRAAAAAAAARAWEREAEATAEQRDRLRTELGRDEGELRRRLSP